MLLAPGPEDRIGPLAPVGSPRLAERLRMPTILAACALVAGIGTAAIVRPWRGPPLRAEIVRPTPPEPTPLVGPPPSVVLVPPPPTVVAATLPPEAAEAAISGNTPERVPAAAGPNASLDGQDTAPVKPAGEGDLPRRGRGAPQDRETRPSPSQRRREVRSIRRPRTSAPAAEVEETGSNAAKPRTTKPDPLHSAPAKTWNLPSVLRPDGM